MSLTLRSSRLKAMAAAVAAALLFLSCSKKSTDNDVTDGTAPAVVSDLAVSAVTATSVSLTWTAVGDDGNSGRASSYDLRYWDHTIDWANFDSAVQATGEPSPKTSGQSEIMTVAGLKTDSLYYFALQVRDEEGNFYGVSNCVLAACFNDHVVTFADPALDGAVRAAIGLPAGDIYRSDLMPMQELDASGLGIADLAGIEQCTSLEHLNLDDNALTGLDSLSNLSALTELWFSGNAVDNIEPLAGLSKLAIIQARENYLSNLGPLSNLNELTQVDLQDNDIVDIGPLVANDALGTGDVIWLTLNPLSSEAVDDHIPALRARGVIVNWWPDVQPPTIIDDLTVDSSGATWAALSWTAPSDNNPSTLAYGYEMRYSVDSAVVAGWTDATEAVGMPDPGTPGTAQAFTINALSTETTWFFAIKARDIYGNWSARSNIVKARLFEDVVVAVPDDSLEAALRETLGKPTGDILRSDLDTLREFRAQSRGIVSLIGLEYCAQLRILDLLLNQITDIGPVAALAELQQLQIGGNDISNLSPIASLENLQTLQLSNNPVSDLTPISALTDVWYFEAMGLSAADFSPVSSLTGLRQCFVSVNGLTDISFLTSCTLLTHLYADANELTDLSPLTNLEQLQVVSAHHNQVTEISSLVANSGLGGGDVLYLQNNPLTQQCIDEQIPALQARGVSVTY